MKTVLEHESLVKGIVYQDTTTPSYESQIEELDESALTKKISVFLNKSLMT